MTEQWQVLVPIKRLSMAKTRLAADPEVRRDLALAMALDTLAVVQGACRVEGLWVVSADCHVRAAVKALGIELVDEPGSTQKDSLNAALSAGLRAIDELRSQQHVAIVTADLPAMNGDDLDQLLESGLGHRRAVVADRNGSGTTVLTGPDAHSVDPQFGRNSLARHLAAGAVRLDAGEGLRLDVDTPDDLVTALLLGVGPRTYELAMRHRLGVVN